MKHYKNLWKFAPGAMLFVHVIVVGMVISAALLKRDGEAALIAILTTLMVAIALVPVCEAWDRTR